MATRASGARALTLLKFKSDYESPATGNFMKMPFTRNELGGERSLVDDPVLGFGRDPADPLLDVLNVSGDIAVPVDTRYFGLWLKGLFGAPTTTVNNKADGQIVFLSNPVATQTITINGVAFTFIAGASTGQNIQIGANVAATIDNVVTALNASANVSVSAATYSRVGSALQVIHDTGGTAGNAFTLAASHARPSDKTLIGGGNKHTFVTGVNDLPCADIERCNPEINRYRMFDSVKFNSLALDFQRSGAAQAVIGTIARGQQAITSASQGGVPQELTFERISQFKGYVKEAGVFVGNLTSASLQHTNNLEAIQVIRDDDRIQGADEGITSITGTAQIRLSNEGLLAKAEAETKTDLELGYKLTPAQVLRIKLHRITMSIPKDPISGPGGISATINYQASRDATVGRLATIELINDLDGTQYA